MSIFDGLIPHIKNGSDRLDNAFCRILDRLDELTQAVRDGNSSHFGQYERVSKFIPASTTQDIFTVPMGEFWHILTMNAQDNVILRVTGSTLWSNGAVINQIFASGEGIPVFPGETVVGVDASGVDNTVFMTVRRQSIESEPERFRQGRGRNGLISGTGDRHDSTRDIIDTGPAQIPERIS